MKCYKCGNETIETNGSTRGKKIYVCKVCEPIRKFTTEKPPYNEIDKWLAYELRIRRDFTARDIVKMFGCSVGTAHKWISVKKPPKMPDEHEITKHVRNLPNGKEIAKIFGVILND